MKQKQKQPSAYQQKLLDELATFDEKTPDTLGKGIAGARDTKDILHSVVDRLRADTEQKKANLLSRGSVAVRNNVVEGTDSLSETAKKEKLANITTATDDVEVKAYLSSQEAVDELDTLQKGVKNHHGEHLGILSATALANHLQREFTDLVSQFSDRKNVGEAGVLSKYQESLLVTMREKLLAIKDLLENVGVNVDADRSEYVRERLEKIERVTIEDDPISSPTVPMLKWKLGDGADGYVVYLSPKNRRGVESNENFFKHLMSKVHERYPSR